MMLEIVITFILSSLLQVSGTTTIEGCNGIRCSTGVCLNNTVHCDGINNCGDWSDELGCYNSSVTECGMQRTQVSSSRVVGGKGSYPGQWPWMLSYDVYGKHICGASLISEQWAITAAHCIHSFVDRKSITAGITTLDDNSVFRESVHIAETFVHPEYDDVSNDNDIALLRLDSPVQFNQFVQPICHESLEYLPDTLCHVAGWGRLSQYGTYPNTLQDTSVPLLSIEKCRRLLSKYPYDVTDKMICAGYASGSRDTCYGDSGGPLMCKSDDGTWNLVGITSWGIGCALPKRPGVYTKVSEYAEFIQQTIMTSAETTPDGASASTALDNTADSRKTESLITNTMSTDPVASSGVVTNIETTVSTPKMFTPTTRLPRREAFPKEVLTIVDVDMYVTASDVKEKCANDPSLVNCPHLIKEFEEEFDQAYYNFDPDAFHGLIVTNISSLDDTSLTVYTTDNKLIVCHSVEYKYTEFHQSITNDQFIRGVFGNNTKYGNFIYDDSSVDIDTDFCNENYYYPCESSFAFRCNDENEPECASKCEDEFDWCNGGSCDAIGDISCDCSELENERVHYFGTRCTRLECKTSGNIAYYGENCELTSCMNTDIKWYIGENCKFTVYKIVGMSVGGAFFLFMITVLICLSCKFVARRKVDDLEDSMDKSLISAYEEDDRRFKLSSCPVLSGMKNPTYFHEEKNGDSIHKDRPFSDFQPCSPVDSYYSTTTFGNGNDVPGIFPTNDRN